HGLLGVGLGAGDLRQAARRDAGAGGGPHGRAHDSRIDDPAGHGREVVGGDVDQLGADGQRDRAGEDVVVGGDAALGVVGAGGGADDLDHEDGPAHGGDGVRALDL